MNVTTKAAARTVSRRKLLPGFGITMGFSVLYLSLVVLLPLSALLFNSTGLSWAKFWDVATDARVLASYRVSLSTAGAAALINVVLGLLLAWVLVRYEFPGKRIFDALIDLPFALPTAVAGVSLTALYSQNGWIGSLLTPLGFKVAFTPLGITLALMFIGIPLSSARCSRCWRIWTGIWRKPLLRWGQAAGVPSCGLSCRSCCLRCLRASPWRSPGALASTALSCSSPAICQCAQRSPRC